MTIRFRKAAPPLGPVITTVVMLACLIGLGTWQVKRLAWKTAMIDELAQAYRSDPELTISDFTKAADSKNFFLHGHVTGQLEDNATILIGPRTHDGNPGYHVAMPLRLKSGGSVLVNRGWIDAEKAKLPLTTVPSGDVRITGLARLPDRANIFTPDNHPESGIWYSTDTVQIGTHTGLNLPAYVLYAEQVDGAAQTFPATFQQDWQPPNSHLQYAVFWFSMAGFLTLIFIMRFFIILS